MTPLSATRIDWTRNTKPDYWNDILVLVEKATASALEANKALDADQLMAFGLQDICDAEAERLLRNMWTTNLALQMQFSSFAEAASALIENPPFRQIMISIKMETVATANFLIFGSKTFFFSRALTERLANFELNAPSSALLVPFKSFVFVYDDPVSRAALASIGPGHLAGEGAITTWISVFDGGDNIHLGLLMICQHESHAKALASRILKITPDNTIEDALRTEWTADKEDDNDDQFIKNSLFIRIALNSILYLNSSNPEISTQMKATDIIPIKRNSSPSKARQHARYVAKRYSALTYVRVGDSVHSLDIEARSRGIVHAERILVRGHWRNQAHGQGRSERKLIAIEPYWRGPEMAEVVTRPYKVN